MNYGQVKAHFTGLMNRRDLTANTALVDTFCQQAIARIQRKLRVPAMQRQISLTSGSGFTGNSFPIPNDLLELDSITYTDSFSARTLREEALDAVLREALLTYHPYSFARQGTSYVLAPTPSAGDILSVSYYAEFPAVALDADTNFLTNSAPDAIVYGALSYAADYYLDNRVDAFEGRFQQVMQELETQALREELVDGAAVSSAYSFSDDC